MILIFVVVLTTAFGPLITFAAGDYAVTQLPAIYTEDSVTLRYQKDTPPPVIVKFFPWVGEYDPTFKNFATWTKDLGSIATMTPSNTVPFTFGATLYFGDLELVPGKIYAYLLADQTTEQDAFFFSTSATASKQPVVSCFTTTRGSIPCATPPAEVATTCLDPQTCEALTLELTSVTAPNTTVVFKGILSTVEGTVDDAIFDLYLGTSEETLKKITPPIFTKTKITPEGISFMKTITGLIANKEYFYKFVETSKNISFPDDGAYSFSTSYTGEQDSGSAKEAEEPAAPTNPPVTPATPANPSPATGGSTTLNFGTTPTVINGTCGSANGVSSPVLTANSANLCASGTASGFTAGESWQWSCVGSNNGSTVSCSGTKGTDQDYGSGALKNPLAPGLDSLPKIFAAVVNNIVLPVAVPFIAIMIIYSGFLFVIARKNGDTFTLDKAKTTFKYTMIGAALILGAFVIANALQGTLNQLLG